eukprot:scaffold347573_cov18-Prasinocladus_malaysianus.AAC.1
MARGKSKNRVCESTEISMMYSGKKLVSNLESYLRSIVGIQDVRRAATANMHCKNDNVQTDWMMFAYILWAR